MDDKTPDVITPDKQGANTGHKWQPGQSGNPAGRPKKGNTLTEAMQEFLDQTPPPTDAGQPTMSYKEAFIRKVYTMAMDKNNPSDAAIRLIWNYIDGMPLQGIDVTTKGKALNPLVMIDTHDGK